MRSSPTSLMVNVDAPGRRASTAPAATAYVTGGIGSFTSETVLSDVTIGPTQFEDRRTTTDFATNVGAGVNYQINRWVGVGADYRTFFVHRDESAPRVHRVSAGLTFSLK